MSISRRVFIELAASFGAALAFRSTYASPSTVRWRERRDLYPQGVASGDPHPDSVLLWTRRPPATGTETSSLILEVADDPAFRRIVAKTRTSLTSESDWTCRVLAAGLKSRTVYWYRFVDEHGFGSRIGRTMTAPSDDDDRPVNFAFVSCQMVPAGASNAYRRMIWEDERRSREEQLGFVLHLGDFVYEIVWYPEDRPQGYYDRKLRDVVRYPRGEKIRDFHVPTCVDDYRVLYQAYLSDPDLQDARARWPFVCMWDNHEFSWKGWQSQQDFGGVRPAQTRKVAANQAWFEHQPARVAMNKTRDVFTPPPVRDAPLTDFDDYGLGLEPGNLAAVNSLKLYRNLRWGRNVELMLTDNRSFRSEPVMHRADAAVFQPKGFPYGVSEKIVEILDGGQAYQNGKRPDTIEFNGSNLPNPRRYSPPQSMLGRIQKEWFLKTLRASVAQWKLWGNSVGMFDWRLDFQNLPVADPKWPDAGYATLIDDDWSAYRHERAEILNFIRTQKITNTAALCGDRHAFEAGLISPSLRPHENRPVFPEFITASISAPGLFEAAAYNVPKNHPLRPVYVYEPATGGNLQSALNFSLMHGVRAAFALQRTGDPATALAERNREVAPNLAFVDVGGHGYSVVRATSEELGVEFVCIPRPLQRANGEDGGPVLYRISHRVTTWNADVGPRIERTKVEGTLPLVL